MERTLITFILDKSGSMGSIRSATIEAFNSYVSGLQEDFKKNGGSPIDFTFIQFDSQEIEKHYVEKSILDVPLLTHDTFKPRGSTPLLDAVGEAIGALDSVIAKKADKPKVIVCIQTDGEENCSREYTWDTLKKLIAEKQEAGWQFNFMGAGIDAYKQSAQMGLSSAATLSYEATDMGKTRAAFAASAQNASAYRTGLRADTSYSVMQKSAAGDAFDPAAKGIKPGPIDVVVGAAGVGKSVFGNVGVQQGWTDKGKTEKKRGLEL